MVDLSRIPTVDVKTRPSPEKLRKPLLYFISEQAKGPYKTLLLEELRQDLFWACFGLRIKSNETEKIKKWHWAHEGYRGFLDSMYSCLRSLREDRLAIRRGKAWGLSAQGFKEAQEHSIYRENLSALWLQVHYTKLFERLTKHLKTKMPRSAEFNKIDGHIHGYLERVIRLDSFRPYLLQGRPLAYSTICGWCRRSSYSQIRDEATDVLCRHQYGSLTRAEVDGYDSVTNWTEMVIPSTINRTSLLNVSNASSNSEDDAQVDLISHVADPRSVGHDFSDDLEFEEQMARIEDIIKSRTSGMDLELFNDRFRDEMTVREIAERHGLTRTQVQGRINTMRKRLKRDLRAM